MEARALARALRGLRLDQCRVRLLRGHGGAALLTDQFYDCWRARAAADMPAGAGVIDMYRQVCIAPSLVLYTRIHPT